MKIIKHVFVFFIFLSLIITILIWYNFYRQKKVHKFEFDITDKKILDTLVPIENLSYNSSYLRISGSVNDSISVYQCDGCYKVLLSGNIDTLLVTEFYGGANNNYIHNRSIIKIDPYKATQGRLEIEHSIQ